MMMKNNTPKNSGNGTNTADVTYIQGTPTQQKTVAGWMSRLLDHPLPADCLACALLTVAVQLALTSFLELPGGAGALWGAAVMAVGLFAVLRLRWWLTPLALIAFVGVNAIMHYYWRDLPQWIAYWSGFAGWVWQGLPYRELYTENNGLLLVQGLITGLVAAVLFPLVRRPRLFPVALLISGGALVALFVASPADFSTIVCTWVAGLIILLPGLQAHFGLQTPARARMQMLAIPGAVLAVGLSLWLTPADTSHWRALWLHNLVTDVQALWEGPFRTATPLYSDFITGEMGLHPLLERMGGPAQLEDRRILDVRTDTPVLLRGQVLDVYTGNNWATGWYDGDLRYDSLLWRGRRRDVFQLNLPSGRGVARKMYQDLTKEIKIDVIYLESRFSSLFLAGRPRQFSLSRYLDDTEAFFNLRGELYTHQPVPRHNGTSAITRIWDKSLPDFDVQFLALEQETINRRDDWLEDNAARYTALPDTLPASVGALAADITKDATTPYQKAQALSQWLAENCVYSLEPEAPPPEADFVAHFLETRIGYCTYYASAMAVLARAVDLPARYVTGFALEQYPTRLGTGQENRYLATGETAHAWVEIYFSGIGWLEFDPLSWDVQNPLNAQPEEEAPVAATDVTAPEPLPTEPEFVLEAPVLPTPEEGTPEEGSMRWLLILVGLGLAVVFLAAGVYGLALYGRRRFRCYELDYALRRHPDNGACMEYYYRDILCQLALLDMRPQPGETLVTFPQRADKRFVFADAALAPVANAMMTIYFAQDRDSIGPGDLRSAYTYHRQLEELLTERLGKWRYLWHRVLTGGR